MTFKVKVSIFIFAFTISGFTSNPQNLIPNPSFEDHDTCPNTVSQLNYCTGWEQILETSDYYHLCGSGDGDFTNYFGNRCPNSGDAYAGSICCWSILGPRVREILGTTLISPLVTGQKYYCTFHLSLANKGSYRMGIDKFGIKLSKTQFANDTTIIDNNSFFHTDSVVLDTGGWVQIKQSFIADSAYQYIALGVFYEDNLLIMDNSLTPVQKTYYYIDDVYLSVDSNTCNYPVVTTCYPTGINDPSVSDPVKIYPVPFTEYLNIETIHNDPGELCFYDGMGQMVFRQNINLSERINSSHLMPGFYFYTFSIRNRVVKSGKISKQ